MRRNLWDDLIAIDAVVVDVAKNFDGEDLALGDARCAGEGAPKLSILHEFLSGKEAVEVQDPSEDALELVRIYFDSGVQLMGRI